MIIEPDGSPNQPAIPASHIPPTSIYTFAIVNQYIRMRINPTRLQQHFEEMSLIGKLGETGICRPAHSALEKEAFELASKWMKTAGMTTRIDNFGNLIGRLEGRHPSDPVLMMGSHLDSQPYGGRYDGTAGVLCAIEVVTTLTEIGRAHV